MNTNEDNYRPLEADLIHTNIGISNPLSTDTQNDSNSVINRTNSHTSASDLFLYNRLNRGATEKVTSNMYMNDIHPLNNKNDKLETNDIDSNINVNTRSTLNDISHSNIETQLINKLDPSDPTDLVMDDHSVTQHDMTSEYNTDVVNTERETTPDQPFYVNAKQYYRILKRRYARARLEENLRISRERKPYLHESRHKHAMRRPRGQGGRFLTAAEIEDLKSRGRIDENGDVIPEDKENNNDENEGTENVVKNDIAKIVNKDDNNNNNNSTEKTNVSITSEVMPIKDKK